MPTDAELEAIEAAAIETATAGVSSFSSDGVSAVALDPLKQLQFADEVRKRAITDPFKTMRHRRLISPGGGGQ